MFSRTDDLRIENLRPLLPPAILMEEFPADDKATEVVVRGREAVGRLLAGRDDRLLVVVGPCSIHDPLAALEYARRLVEVASEFEAELCILMRVYFEKPRTTVGWKGLINDPRLDGSFAINEGLRTARRLLLDVIGIGLGVATEFLDPISPQFIADLICWGAVGARTSESQVHRELASGLSMPVGFKNGTDGGVQVAVDAIHSAAHPHQFLSVTKQGVAAIVATRGNQECHVILRGGTSGPNYPRECVLEVADTLRASGLPSRMMVDCSHANSGKDHSRQPEVVADLSRQIAGGSDEIFGIMLESFLLDGRQNHSQESGASGLDYGQSITDACLGWDRTHPLFSQLAEAVRARRGR
jgi:3-deoxy-7-phosphoheptulonate synthase